jgi:hypothetical protein
MWGMYEYLDIPMLFFGDASEHIITTLANVGAAQVSVEMDGIIAHLIS